MVPGKTADKINISIHTMVCWIGEQRANSWHTRALWISNQLNKFFDHFLNYMLVKIYLFEKKKKKKEVC